MKTNGLLFALLMVWASTSFAQVDNGNGQFGTRIYSDFYWMAAHHDEDVEGNNGFWIRRVYFTYDHQINDTFSARFRLEGNSPGNFTDDEKITPVVKDLYLRWENDRHQVVGGISPTPTFALVEDIWGYRSIEKTPLDLLDFGSSRDFGIAARGQLDEEGKLSYNFMFGNGNSNNSEINIGKKTMLALSYQLNKNLLFEAYGDWNDNPGETDRVTLQGFVAWQSDNYNVGILYAHQNRANAAVSPGGVVGDLNLDLASVFANFIFSEQTGGFLRIDHAFDPVPGGEDIDYLPISSDAEATIVIGGLDFEIYSDIHLMPNVESVIYGEDAAGITPATDLVPRLTLYYEF